MREHELLGVQPIDRAATRPPTSAAPLQVVTARGDRFAVGFEHGSQAADKIAATLDWSLEQLAVGGVQPAEATRRVELLQPYVHHYAPELIQEARGIAAGAGLTLTDVLVINSRYELLFLDGVMAPRPGVAGAECTLFGLPASRTASGAPMIGQNVDLGAEARELWILLDAEPLDAPRFLTVTMAGMLAQEGINASGLALCGSMVRSRGWGEGLPTRKFLRRKVLEQRSLAAAIRTIEEAPQRASSHNLLLADATSVVDVETTAREVRALWVGPAGASGPGEVGPIAGRSTAAPPGRGVPVRYESGLAHSNHYLHADFAGENAELGAYLGNSEARCARLQQLIDEAPARLELSALRAWLADHALSPNAVCRHGEIDAWRGETNVAVIAEPARRTLHVANGPPCSNEFHAYTIPPEPGGELLVDADL